MTRLSMRSMGNAIDAQHIGTRTLAADQLRKRRILEREARATSDPALISALAHQDKIIARNKAAIQYGAGRRKPKRSPNQRRRKDFKIPEGFDVCGLSHGRSYSCLTGARMEKKQAGFPDIMRHPTTIHLMPVPLSGDLNPHSPSKSLISLS